MPDSTIETMWGNIDSVTNNGDAVVVKIFDEKWAGHDKQYSTAVGVKRGDNTALAEQVENDLQKGMRVGVRFDVSEYYISNYTKNVKSRTLIEILGRGEAGGGATQNTSASSNEFIPSPAQVWGAGGQERGNAVSNSTNLVATYYNNHKELPDDEWMKQAVKKVLFGVEQITNRREELVEGEVVEDAPF